MRLKRIVPLPPFKVERMAGSTLVEQVVGGIRQAIISGVYKPGDVLPSLSDLAEHLGVSRIVTRHAIRKLADERLIDARPSAGCVVLDSKEQYWKGRVLIVRRNNGCQYYSNVFESALCGLLAKDRWLCISASVIGASGGRPADISEIKAMAASPVNLAIVLFDNPGAAADAPVPHIISVQYLCPRLPGADKWMPLRSIGRLSGQKAGCRRRNQESCPPLPRPAREIGQ